MTIAWTATGSNSSRATRSSPWRRSLPPIFGALERRLARLERRTRAASSGAKPARFRALLEAALELPRQTNRWLLGLSSPLAKETGVPLRATLESSIRHSLRAPLAQLLRGNPSGLEFPEFTRAWQLDDQGPPKSIYKGGSPIEQIDAALPEIRPTWQPFADAIGEWAALSRPHLAKAFEGNSSHEPHIALLVAFARLFSVAQESINAVAGRRTSFYFRRVLRESHRPAAADTVHVAFTCAGEQEPGAIVVPAGTLLSAGKDMEGRQIVFASQDDVRVTSASLRKVLTVRVVSGPLGDGIDQFVTQRVLAREVDPGESRPEGWWTFGSPNDAPADIGFAISSSALELAGGERSVTLALRYDVGAGAAAALTALGAATGLTQPLLLERALEKAFTLDVSTTAGWFHVDRYVVLPSPEEGDATFRLRFTLSQDAPAITGIPGSGVAWPNPAVRARLRQERVLITGPQPRRFDLSLVGPRGLRDHTCDRGRRRDRAPRVASFERQRRGGSVEAIYCPGRHSDGGIGAPDPTPGAHFENRQSPGHSHQVVRPPEARHRFSWLLPGLRARPGREFASGAVRQSGLPRVGDNRTARAVGGRRRRRRGPPICSGPSVRAIPYRAKTRNWQRRRASKISRSGRFRHLRPTMPRRRDASGWS